MPASRAGQPRHFAAFRRLAEPYVAPACHEQHASSPHCISPHPHARPPPSPPTHTHAPGTLSRQRQATEAPAARPLRASATARRCARRRWWRHSTCVPQWSWRSATQRARARRWGTCRHGECRGRGTPVPCLQPIPSWSAARARADQAWRGPEPCQYQPVSWRSWHDTMPGAAPLLARCEEELDPVTLHNSALAHMDSDPGAGFKKLNHLLSLREWRVRASALRHGCQPARRTAVFAAPWHARTPIGAHTQTRPPSAHHAPRACCDCPRSCHPTQLPPSPGSVLSARDVPQSVAAVRVTHALLPGPGRRRDGRQPRPGAAHTQQGGGAADRRTARGPQPAALMRRLHLLQAPRPCSRGASCSSRVARRTLA